MNQQQFEINKRLVQQHVICLNTSSKVDDLTRVYLKDYSLSLMDKIFKANKACNKDRAAFAESVEKIYSQALKELKSIAQKFSITVKRRPMLV